MKKDQYLDFNKDVVERLREALGLGFHITSGWVTDKDEVYVFIRPVFDIRLNFDGVALIDENFEKNFNKKILPGIKAQLANWAYTLQQGLESEE